jgi:hypothetical protein
MDRQSKERGTPKCPIGKGWSGVFERQPWQQVFETTALTCSS